MIVFLATSGATLLMLLVTAGLLGLKEYESATSLLPLTLGLAVVLSAVYAWHLFVSNEQRVIAGVVLALACVAFLLVTALRGVDVWIQQIFRSNELAAAGGPVPNSPVVLTDIRSFLPAPVYFTVELAIFFGVMLAHGAVESLVAGMLWIGCLILRALLFLIWVIAMVVVAASWLVVKSVEVVLDMVHMLPRATINWLLGFERVGALFNRGAKRQSIDSIVRELNSIETGRISDESEVPALR